MKVSKKQIIDIRLFMENYIGKKYDDNNKLTHREMNIFLCEKGVKLPKRLSFSKIKKEDILKWNCLLVKDESGKVIPYENTRFKSINRLVTDFNNTFEIERLRNIRLAILDELGYEEDCFGRVIEKDTNDYEYYEENITYKVNRNKTLIKYNNRFIIKK